MEYNTGLLTLWDSTTVSGTWTSKTYTFTYTWKPNVSGTTQFTLKTGAVKDIAGNGNVTTWSSNVEVDNEWPSTPEIVNDCGSVFSDVMSCIGHNIKFCPQYDFREDWVINSTDATTSFDVCPEDKYIKNDWAITSSSKPKLLWKYVEATWCAWFSWYELQICSDSSCNTVIKSWSYAEVSWPEATTNLSDGTYYWRVRAQDELWNWWNWSDIWSFTVDTTAPSCTITEAACTSGALVLTLTWSEDIKTPSGWTKVNGTTYTKEVTSNDTVSVEVTDLVWNTWSCSITPSNYDNTAPSTSASGVPSDWTGSNVTVTLSAGSNGCVYVRKW